MANFNRYNSSFLFKYKTGYISGYSFFDGHWPVGKYTDIINVQFDQSSEEIKVKSIHAAKILITRHANRGKK